MSDKIRSIQLSEDDIEILLKAKDVLNQKIYCEAYGGFNLIEVLCYDPKYGYGYSTYFIENLITCIDMIINVINKSCTKRLYAVSEDCDIQSELKKILGEGK